MKYIIVAALALSLGACTPEKETDRLQFFNFSPGDKYQNNYPGDQKSSFLPYAYFRQETSSEAMVPFATEYWLNINKNDRIVGHVIFKSEPKDSDQCFEIRETIASFLIKHGFEKAQPRGAFVKLIAKKGDLLALYSCGRRFMNYGTPEEKSLPPEMELSITTEEQHQKFEQAMKDLEH